MADKQTQAVIFNFKEQRRLEKTLQSLKIEEAYAISLINLDNKVLKIGYKRLKDRVSKTKSHLTNDQINEMKQLEEEGKITEKVIKMESENRIAAAEKRLKLWSAKKTKTTTPRSVRAQTAPECRAKQTHDSRRSSSSMGAQSRHSTLDLKSVKEMRRKSIDLRDSMESLQAGFKQTDKRLAQMHKSLPITNIYDNADGNVSPKRKADIRTDAFMNCPRTDQTKRRKSVDIRTPEEMKSLEDSMQFDKESRPILKQVLDVPNTEPKTVSIKRVTDVTNSDKNPAIPVVSKPDRTTRPQSGSFVTPKTRPANLNKKRPTSSVPLANTAKEKAMNNIRRASKLLSGGKTSTPFSSHDLDPKQTKSALDSPFRSIREGTMTAFDDHTIDKDHGDELHKEMKKGLLLKEIASSLQLEDKIDNFFEKVDDYIEPKEPELADIVIPVSIFKKDTKEEKKPGPKRNQLRRRELELALHGNVTENDRTEEVWKDVNKCRYLRVPEELIDLTGIQTLASDQLKLFEMLRRGEYA